MEWFCCHDSYHCLFLALKFYVHQNEHLERVGLDGLGGHFACSGTCPGESHAFGGVQTVSGCLWQQFPCHQPSLLCICCDSLNHQSHGFPCPEHLHAFSTCHLCHPGTHGEPWRHGGQGCLHSGACCHQPGAPVPMSHGMPMQRFGGPKHTGSRVNDTVSRVFCHF